MRRSKALRINWAPRPPHLAYRPATSCRAGCSSAPRFGGNGQSRKQELEGKSKKVKDTQRKRRMRPMRIAVAWLIIASLGTPAFAGDLRSSVAKAAEEQAQSQS